LRGRGLRGGSRQTADGGFGADMYFARREKIVERRFGETSLLRKKTTVKTQTKDSILESIYALRCINA
jgi:hypothetical protein